MVVAGVFPKRALEFRAGSGLGARDPVPWGKRCQGHNAEDLKGSSSPGSASAASARAEHRQAEGGRLPGPQQVLVHKFWG